MRPIDADALMPSFIKKANTMEDRHGVKLGDEWLLNYNDIKDVIDTSPTVLHDNYSMGYQDGVKRVLSERSQGEWISVKDRLPDKDGDYIVTTEMFLPIDNFIREVEVTEYNLVTGFCCETPAIKVIAWQELILPEAYKEAEND